MRRRPMLVFAFVVFAGCHYPPGFNGFEWRPPASPPGGSIDPCVFSPQPGSCPLAVRP